MTPAIASTSDSYRSRFLLSLITVSLVPSVLTFLNFVIFSGRASQVAFAYSILAIASGTHVWMNIAYFASRKWRKYFGERPFHFYVAPALIIVAMTTLLAQPIKGIGLAAMYAVGFVNIWHHAKQNWGILAMIGRLRGRNVSAMMKPVCYAWIFFIAPTCLQDPAIANWAGVHLIYQLSLVCLGCFAIYYGYSLVRSNFLAKQDGYVMVAAIAMFFYFVPVLFIRTCPWLVSFTAGAHALQYYMMVFASLSLNGRRTAKSLGTSMMVAFVSMAALSAIAVVTIKTGYNQWDNAWLRAVFGAFLGINLAHFWVDAFIWKFNNPNVRELHGDAFSF